MAPPNDLGDISDLAQVDEEILEDLQDGPLEDIIAVSPPSSNAASPPMLDLNEPAEVEVMVFIPMKNGEQMMINPHETNEDELMEENLEIGHDIDVHQQHPVNMDVEQMVNQQQEQIGEQEQNEERNQMMNFGFVQACSC